VRSPIGLEVRSRPVAVLAAGLVAILLAATLIGFIDEAWRILVDVPLLFIAFYAAWYSLTRTGSRRLVASIIGAASLIGIAVSPILAGEEAGSLVLLRVVLLLLAVGFGSYSLGRAGSSSTVAATPDVRVRAANRGVLVMNPRSGGGKVAHHHLVEECVRRGIQPLLLGPGKDLVALVKGAIDSGADVIGMAGGDGSMAAVAGIAAERGIPMVAVPAGTRNHLAGDLGLDRHDVVGALDAFDEAVEREVDVGDVNGRPFMNNVSLGLYAAIIRSPEYRSAKRDTTLAAIPNLLGPGSRPFDLRFKGPDGTEHRAAHMIQVSNNPYLVRLGGRGVRPSMHSRRLGVIALEIDDDRAAAGFLNAVAVGEPERFEGFASWTTETFEVTSDSPIEVGLDGESLVLEARLTFSIRERPLRVRLPKRAVGSWRSRHPITGLAVTGPTRRTARRRRDAQRSRLETTGGGG
jgi:diacylglycerol kinase family enzyme